jgi:alpha-beta hydrolase superfamily lysophospholipase
MTKKFNLALSIIKSESNDQVLLKGHSTGGLIITNYAVNHFNSGLFSRFNR